MDRASEPAWDADIAATLVGKRMHLTMTYRDNWGVTLGAAPFLGVVTAANRHAGILLVLDDGDGAGVALRIPPDLGAFDWASPGERHAAAIGGSVPAPEIQATWNIAAPERAPAVFWVRCGRRKGDPEGTDRAGHRESPISGAMLVPWA